MDRFNSGDAIENGGMFSREQIQRLSQYISILYCIGKLCNSMDQIQQINSNLPILQGV